MVVPTPKPSRPRARRQVPRVEETMAIVYSTPLPRYVQNDPMRAADRRVYEALGEGLGRDHSVFYGVAWLARTPRGVARDG